MPLDDFSPTDRSHPDAVGAALAVRAVLESAPVRHLDSRTVEICVDDERLRGAYFRFAHDADREARILIHQRDGWFHLESPLGTYDGHLDDEDLRDFLTSLLTGALRMTTRWRGRGVVERSWTWTDRAGITRALAERMPLRVAWRRLVPLRERIERRSLSFDRVPAVRLET